MNTMTAPILDQLSALGDPTRSRILAVLERSELTVSELCAVLQLPQPTVSRHLKTLAGDGWVASRADGRNRHYRFSSSLEPHSAGLWRIVRDELESDPRIHADSERAREVLATRRLKSQEFFANASNRWDELRMEMFGKRAELFPLFGLLDSRWTVGDLGTGTGGLAATVAPFVGKVVAIDRSAEMLSGARARLADARNVELRQGELESLPVSDGELDVALLSLVLHYVVDPTQVLMEVRRTLAPDGRVLILDMRAHERGPEYSEEMGHVWPGFDPEAVVGWMEAADFTDIRVLHVPPDPEASGPALFLASARVNQTQAVYQSQAL
jgi:ArsR family transcriptional regulator